MKFHLSVNADGVVSLWDHDHIAQNISDEGYTSLELTDAQARQVRIAQLEAKIKIVKAEIAAIVTRHARRVAVDDEACPGCGCKPGDGRTPGCLHPEGCAAHLDDVERRDGGDPACPAI